nr:AimR family lysis-lysogeny pheromone receptor [Bacillus sonorensis]
MYIKRGNVVKELELKSLLKNKCEEERGLEKELAKIAGYSNSSGFHQFIFNDKKEMDNIQGLINVVQRVSPDNEFELMSEYILTLDPNKSAARQGLEYLSVNQLYDTLDTHIENLRAAKNTISKEWGKVYSLQRELDCGKISIEECIRILGEINPKSPEMKVYSRLIPMYAALSLNQFTRLMAMSEDVILNRITTQNYVYYSYKSRYMLLLANCCFGSNDLKKAREYAKYGINNSNVKRIIFFSYLTYGTTLMFSDYSSAKEIFLKGMEIAKGNDFYEQQIKRSLCFLENVWNKENQYLNIESNEIMDKQEVIHYLIRKGNIDEAKRMLEQIEKLHHDDYELGMHFYLKGLIDNSQSHFLRSIKHFKISGDKFSTTLPIIELEKLGLDKAILDVLTL